MLQMFRGLCQRNDLASICVAGCGVLPNVGRGLSVVGAYRAAELGCTEFVDDFFVIAIQSSTNHEFSLAYTKPMGVKSEKSIPKRATTRIPELLHWDHLFGGICTHFKLHRDIDRPKTPWFWSSFGSNWRILEQNWVPATVISKPEAGSQWACHQTSQFFNR